MAITTEQLGQWTALVTAAQPLVDAGVLLVKDLVGLFHNAHPDATDAELNVAFGALYDEAAVERAAIAQERAAALPPPSV